jgi:hypothetical protein
MLAGCTAGIGLTIVEVVLRCCLPHEGLGMARELRQFRCQEGFSNLFCLDPDFGFRPVLGNAVYNTFGTRANDYPVARRAGVRRVLFAGDSVTFRGFILDALREHYGEEGIEYWNAGVESFNTVQEVAFYERFNMPLQPDDVVLSFHLNDFETTPVAFQGPDGTLVVYAPNMPHHAFSLWWFRHSRVYRLLVGLRGTAARNIDAVMLETRDALHRLEEVTAAQGTRLTVVILPLLKPVESWTAGDRWAHRAIVAMLSELGIRHIDLLPALRAALDDGLEVCETPGDDWHPSRAAARVFAAHLFRQHLLEPRNIHPFPALPVE